MFKGKTVVTGIRPTGSAHLGNLVGAIKPVIEMSEEADKSFVFIADLHALNSVRNSEEIIQSTRELTATFLSLGLDTSKTALFRQSDVFEISQLTILLSNMVPKGLINRSHAYKSVVDNNINNENDKDAGVNMGLFMYPVLMASDILAYNADVVPVGQDQKQHVEFARDIAGYFNNTYSGDIIKMPEPIIQKNGHSIPGCDGRKMSKSYDNTIKIFEDPKLLKKKVMRIVTDSKRPEDKKDPDSSTIFQLYTNFASEAEIESMRHGFVNGGMGYGDAKKLLLEAILTKLQEPRASFEKMMSNPSEIDAVLEHGASIARLEASKALKQVHEAMLGRKPEIKL